MSQYYFIENTTSIKFVMKDNNNKKKAILCPKTNYSLKLNFSEGDGSIGQPTSIDKIETKYKIYICGHSTNFIELSINGYGYLSKVVVTKPDLQYLSLNAIILQKAQNMIPMFGTIGNNMIVDSAKGYKNTNGNSTNTLLIYTSNIPQSALSSVTNSFPY